MSLGWQETPSTTSILASMSSQFTAARASASRAGIWVVDEATGCLQYCNYSSTASMMYRCHKYLNSALEQPEFSNPFAFEHAASSISTANGRPHLDLMSMTRLQEEHYLNLFWQSYHILLPMLDFESFTQHYSSLWILNNSVRGDSSLVDIVLALCVQYGSCFLNFVGASGGPQAEGSTQVSQYLSDRARQVLLAKTESLSLHTVQCHLLSAIYLVNSSLTNAAHDCIARALRSALALGLHHEPPATMPEQERVLRQNIWWSIYTMDVRISLGLGQPFLVHHSGPTCPLPLQSKNQERPHLQTTSQQYSKGCSPSPSFANTWISRLLYGKLMKHLSHTVQQL